MTEPSAAATPPMRASNADRERVAQVLNVALAEGRLDVHELQERLDAVYGAKTLAELEPLTRDLPGHQPVQSVSLAKPSDSTLVTTTPAQPVLSPRVGGGWTSTSSIAVMSGAERKGEWVVPPKYTAVAIMGGIELDLTQARYGAAEVVVNCIAIMGGIEVTVPEDITVIVDGFGFMGAFEERGATPPIPGAPIVRFTGAAVMGGIEVRRPKKPKRKKLEKG